MMQSLRSKPTLPFFLVAAIFLFFNLSTLKAQTTLSLGHITSCPGSELYVPVISGGFSNMATYDIFIALNADQVKYLSVTNYHPLIAAGYPYFHYNSRTQILFISFMKNPAHAGITVAPGSKLFDIRVQYIGGNVALDFKDNSAFTNTQDAVIPTAFINGSLLPSVSFSVPPVDANVDPGMPAQFFVEVAPADPLTTYLWQKNTGAGWEDLAGQGGYSGQDTPTLTKHSTVVYDHGNLYRVQATLNDCAIMSEPAQLIVTGGTDLFWLYLVPNPSAGGVGTGGGLHLAATEVPVSAEPAFGYHFVEWREGETVVSDQPNLMYLMPDHDVTLTAYFQLNTYTLSYLAGANGRVEGENLQYVQHGNHALPVEAVADEYHEFVRWSDGVTDNPRRDMDVTSDLEVTAEFELQRYTLTYLVGDGGTIEGPAQQLVTHGENGSEVTAVPLTGYHFLAWSDGVTDNPRADMDVTSDLEVTAIFELDTYTLTYLAGENGSLAGAEVQQITHGSSGTAVTAVADTGYHFLEWSDGVTDNPRTDTEVTDNLEVTAYFEINTYLLTYIAGDHGSILGVATQLVIHGHDGSPVQAVAAPGYHFIQWSDGVTDNPRTELSVSQNISVEAYFKVNIYTLTYSVDGNGALEGETEQLVTHGSSGTAVTAVADAGYHFVAWSDGVTDNPRTDADVTANLEVTAHFAINTYTLLYVAGENGAIEGAATQQVDHGSSGTAVTAVADEGYHFTAWSDGVTDNPRTDTDVTAPVEVTAHFVLTTFTLEFAVVTVGGDPLPGAVITLNGEAAAVGHYLFAGLLPGTYSYLVQKDGYFDAAGSVEIAGEDVVVTVELRVDDTHVAAPESWQPRVYPNPVAGILYVDSSEAFDQLRIYDTNGRLVDVWHMEGRLTAEVPVGHLAKGVYVVQLVAGNTLHTLRIQVVR